MLQCWLCSSGEICYMSNNQQLRCLTSHLFQMQKRKKKKKRHKMDFGWKIPAQYTYPSPQKQPKVIFPGAPSCPHPREGCRCFSFYRDPRSAVQMYSANTEDVLHC